MRDAARALDDVSDHLGEVLRHADELLAEWGRFGAQVRTQVEREAGAIGAVVDGAVERAASAGIDRAIAERLRSLSTEVERLEQRTRAAARAVADQRETDRRVLWIVVAGVVLANALLVVLLLRKPEPVRGPDPIRMEAVAPPAGEAHAVPAAGGSDAASTEGATNPAPALGGGAPDAITGGASGAVAGGGPGATAGASSGSNAAASNGANAGASNGASVGLNAAGAKPDAKGPAEAKAGAPGSTPAGASAGSAKPAASPIVLPQKPGAARVHKKVP